MNPYPTRTGLGLRVAYAAATLRDLARGNDGATDPRTGEEYSRAHSRPMDNCFENDDGEAVVWALMEKAQSDRVLMDGIRAFMGGGFEDWQRVYAGPQLKLDM